MLVLGSAWVRDLELWLLELLNLQKLYGSAGVVGVVGIGLRLGFSCCWGWVGVGTLEHDFMGYYGCKFGETMIQVGI